MKKIIESLYALALLIGFPLIMFAVINRTPTFQLRVSNTSSIESNPIIPDTLSGLNTTSLIVKK